VSDGYRGEAFRAFQRAARQLAGQGVLLAAVSKNDIEPVRAVLRGDDRMSLREDDFVRVIANWRPKHDNLRELADGLNIGLESIVFVDDSSFECGLVRRALPEVAVVEVTAEPALHVTNLLRDGWFDVIDVTAEDRARPARYREEQERTDFLRSFDSLADYLRELDVQVRLAPVAPADVTRVSQLTLRTNQFNLTTERLARHQVQELVDGPDAEVLAIHSSDRFGENGLVGAIFLRRGPTALEIDNFWPASSRCSRPPAATARRRWSRATGRPRRTARSPTSTRATDSPRPRHPGRRNGCFAIRSPTSRTRPPTSA
jgi:FkbH-like protein